MTVSTPSLLSVALYLHFARFKGAKLAWQATKDIFWAGQSKSPGHIGVISASNEDQAFPVNNCTCLVSAVCQFEGVSHWGEKFETDHLGQQFITWDNLACHFCVLPIFI